ncbi:DinB family protein [Streptomyces netropsis]|uniref:DinB family protein n=1 Tax=Streptomyces netropsis TaxID=55404 RepID=UPI003791CD90
MSISTRSFPPLNVDERTTLESWLDFHRATLAHKCAGLSDEQAREASARPSELTLTGLVQHMAEVERTWFRRILTGERVAAVHGTDATPLGPLDLVDGHDVGFEVAEGATLEGALAEWQAEIERARANCAPLSLDATGTFPWAFAPGEPAGSPVSLRWIFVHMIEEYARHNGHADLLRERVDGSTGW